MFVSVTRLRVRSLKYLPAFLWYTFLSQRQVVSTSGFAGGRLLIDVQSTYWTLTVWEDEHAMKKFRGTEAHAKVMPHLARWCDEAAYAHWNLNDYLIPSWQESHERLVAEGRLSRVANPSPEHEAYSFQKPRLSPLIGVDLKPKSKSPH